MQWYVVRPKVKLKYISYTTVDRQALLYGAETWTTTRGQRARLEVSEMFKDDDMYVRSDKEGYDPK